MPSLTPERWSQELSQVRAEQVERWQQGQRTPVEDDLARYPRLAQDAAAVLALVAAEVALRLDCGEAPTVEEYVGRFPAHADFLHRNWPFSAALPDTPFAGQTPLAATVPKLPAPAPLVTVPGFEVLEKVGEGGMGVVFKARQTDLDRVVALKMIRAGPLAGEHLLARFRVEERAVGRLDHPGVVRVHSTGQHDGWVFFCMEFLPGGGLDARLRQGPLGFREAAELVRLLALAVEHAHRQGVLHRDLKPANVLLAADGSPRVGDFGLAKLLDGDDGLTAAGAPLGTPSYMAPEQARGDARALGPATDVYALGAVLYECLTGRPPFRSGSRSETLRLVQTDQPADPTSLRPGLPPGLAALCLRCLDKDPGGRFASAALLAQAFQDWLDGKPDVPTQPARWPGFPRKRRTRLGVAGLRALTSIAVVMGFLFIRDPATRFRAQLRAGQPVELIGPTGKPHEQRWFMGGKDSLTRVEADGTFCLQGWPIQLLELLPAVDCDHYRFGVRRESSLWCFVSAAARETK